MAARPFGVLLVDKPAGPTSHEIVQWVRWALGERSVGHCGTLDPAATGLLVLLVGAATRLAPYYTARDKRYRATIALGTATDTADGDGRVLERAPVPAHVWARGASVVAGMGGAHELPPPAHAAIKIDGVRAHALARAGRAPDLPPRPMIVRAVADVQVRAEDGEIEATFDVSKGTYVRSLAMEVGRRLGVPAHLRALRRIRVGTMDLAGSDPVVGPLRAEALAPARDGSPRHRIRPLAARDASRRAQRDLLQEHLRSPLAPDLAPLPVLVAPVAAVARLCQGQPATIPGADRAPGSRARPAASAGDAQEGAGGAIVTDPAQRAVVVARPCGGSPRTYAPVRLVRRPDPELVAS